MYFKMFILAMIITLVLGVLGLLAFYKKLLNEDSKNKMMVDCILLTVFSVLSAVNGGIIFFIYTGTL